MRISHDGYELRIFSSLYMDYGLEIAKDGQSLFYNPHCLNAESWGFHWNDDDTPGEEWTASDWEDRLRYEADDLLDCFLPEGE